jgi:hypothetical protein
MHTGKRSKITRVFTVRNLGWAGLAAMFGCAACCAIPLLAVAGVGGGVTATAAALLWPGAEIALGGLAFGSVLLVGALRGRAGRDDNGAPSTGAGGATGTGGCGCGPPAADQAAQIFGTPPAPPDEPVACTVDLKNTELVQAGLDAYRAAFTHLAATERFPGGFRWKFHVAPGLDLALKTLAEGEHACCRFLTFNIFSDGLHLVWEVRAHDHAASFLDEYAELPQRLRAEPRPGHDMMAVKDRATRAGLVFTSEDREGDGRR